MPGVKPDHQLNYFSIPYGTISAMSESVGAIEKSFTLYITCKDERSFRFKFDVLYHFRTTRKAVTEQSFSPTSAVLPCVRLLPKLSGVKLTSHLDI